MSDTTNLAVWESTLVAGRFEEVQRALEAVVALLDAGNLPLDESVACYTLGMRLADRCEKMLAEAELAVTVLEDLEPPDHGAFLLLSGDDEDETDAPF